MKTKTYVVEPSNNYQRRARVELERMIKDNDFSKLGRIAFGLNKIILWQKIKNNYVLNEKEVAERLLKDLTA